MNKDKLEEMGYLYPRQLPNGKWIALFRFMFTVGLVIDLDDSGYEERYCYGWEHINDAMMAVANWDGEADPPGKWIVHKPSGRQGPGSMRGDYDLSGSKKDCTQPVSV